MGVSYISQPWAHAHVPQHTHNCLLTCSSVSALSRGVLFSAILHQTDRKQHTAGTHPIERYCILFNAQSILQPRTYISTLSNTLNVCFYQPTSTERLLDQSYKCTVFSLSLYLSISLSLCSLLCSTRTRVARQQGILNARLNWI